MNKKEILYLTSVLVILYLFFHLVGIGCPIKWVTGISCAGCGMTRAWISVLHMDFNKAFYYHPLFWVPCVLVLLMIYKSRLKKSVFNCVILTIVVLFVTIYAVRMLQGNSLIVVFEPENNILFRIFDKLKN